MNDPLPPLINIPVSFDAALRVLQWSRQIYVGGFSMMEWAGMWFAFSLGLNFFARIVAYGKAFAGLPSGGNIEANESYYFDEDGEFQSGQRARNAAARDIFGD